MSSVRNQVAARDNEDRDMRGTESDRDQWWEWKARGDLWLGKMGTISGAIAGKEGLALEYSLGSRICSSEVSFHLLAPLNELPSVAVTLNARTIENR